MLIPLREKYIRMRERITAWIASKLWARLQYHVIINAWAWYTTQVDQTAIASDVTISNVTKAWASRKVNHAENNRDE